MAYFPPDLLKCVVFLGYKDQHRKFHFAGSAARSALTKNRLLEIGIEAFAAKGYEGVGTRKLAERAKANLSAIRYHFGDKQGLYRAVIQHISDGIRQRVTPFIQDTRLRAEKPDASPEELIDCLCHLMTSFASQVLGTGVADDWARLITREQLSPTDAFPILYGVLRLLIEAGALVVAKLSGKKPDSQTVRISVMTIVGQILIFRTHRATAMRFIGWKAVGEREVSALQAVITRQCRAIMAAHSDFHGKHFP